MTPECPKGQEGEARPEEVSLREQVMHALCDGYNEQHASSMKDAAIPEEFAGETDAVMAVVSSEVERLTAEVERLRETIRLNAAVTTSEWAAKVAEVSRLREQLAAQPSTDLVERAALWLFRAKTWQMLPDVLQRASKTWHQVLDQQDRDAWIAYARQMLTDLGWGASSSEAEAPSQHKVFVHAAERNWWKATCSTCDITQYSPSNQRAEDWKDQHEADTLRPVLTNESFTLSQDEGRPSGSERLAPHSDEELLRRLRSLVADLQSPSTGTKGEAYDSGFLDGLIQAGNDLEALLDEYAPDAAQAARSEATPRVWKKGDPEPKGVTLISGLCEWRQGDNLLWHAYRNGKRVGHRVGYTWSSLTATFDLTEVPSPSLRKEGEDTAGSASTPPTSGDPDATPRQFVCDQTTHSAIPCVRCQPIPRVWNKGDDEPADHPQVQDCHGDVWSYDENTGMWDTPETVQCYWFRIAKKWSPLTEVPSPSLRKEGDDSA